MNLFENQTRLNQLFTQSPVNAAYLTGSLSTRTTFGHLTDIDVAILLMDQIKADQFLDYQLYFLRTAQGIGSSTPASSNARRRSAQLSQTPQATSSA